MGIKNYLIEGVSGTGKTSVATAALKWHASSGMLMSF